MARKDPPGLIVLPNGVEIEACMQSNDVVEVTIRRWMRNGTKQGTKVHVALETLFKVNPAQTYPEKFITRAK